MNGRPMPESLNEMERQMTLWQPFSDGQSDPTWREFLREQAKVEQDILRFNQDTNNDNTDSLTSDPLWTMSKRPSDSLAEDKSSGREVLTWPSPVIKQHKNGITSFCLDVDVGDTYKPEDIHVNIVDGHVLHIHAKHRFSKQRVKDNTLSASRHHSEFDRRFALPDHVVKPENLKCLVSPEGVLHIRGFLGSKIISGKSEPQAAAAASKKESKVKRSRVNFAVFGKKSR